ncbi:ketol-acid reductoisomerase [Xanthomonas graminis]|jgi:ketol-acid reductoisomerase|uniref:Ketol-acid reductoisomerase (NADP(+)) n=1 Tax=Xanthomonas graminis pv. graminis TaxID=134874 RepID=A0A1M4IMJ8_9XANT|nr:ketol-acid reductoisomerase [Xanthomonas translucens]EKU24124.1 ketol-acid reductoisomerase [Xanthomonas translucens pv. graminis ART-Xtg29]OAX60438.1 ketol-acid reductoisomerase [Xanthomonas translucens pv. graminis]UKE55136.1 ketol-acid reductoisomerase [Xanthomonas translucens pv. graminis]WIH09491.1 ketol-acid reductoisomerase [Xanthomonas translucens pv. graminis]WIH12818.1 ketol-acid reductoisomerase [Xanthomonas translucens pv. graminis]
MTSSAQPTTKIAIVGYGSQGRAHALNLRESGFDVTVGLRAGGPTEAKAQADGFVVKSPADAVKDADLVAVLTPDMVQKKLYDEVLAPNMKQGACLLFAHGLNVHFDMIKPRADLDVVLVAPKGPGALVRREYEIGRGVPCIWAVYQDQSGKAEQFALEYAAGLGGARANLIKTTFKEETETDLFGEQAVLCGGASSLVQAGFEVLVEAGYQPEIAYYEVLHELKLIVDLFYEGGITRMLEFVSETAQYGDYVSGPRVIDAATKERMRDVLTDIQNGTFTKNWVAEYEAGLPNYNAFKQADLQHPIEVVGKQLRAKMVWLNGDAAAAATQPAATGQAA